jgi:hypothetical protein
MKNCTDCKYANWQRTASDKLHPSGDGMCMWLLQIPELPASMWWDGFPPRANGGAINRRKDVAEHCVYWDRAA